MENSDYSKIFKKYHDKMKRRTELFYAQFEEFVRGHNIPADTVALPVDLFMEFLVNYFADIDRLKDFHELERANVIKIAAYESFWWLKIKPIQVVKVVPESREKYRMINEYFVLSAVMSHMYDRRRQPDMEHTPAWNDFAEDLLYHFRHRTFTPQTLELAFRALTLESIYPKKAG